MSTSHPSAAIVIREHRGQPFFEAKFRYEGRQIKRRIGRAWLEQDSASGWRPRRGRLRAGFYDLRGAHVQAAEVVKRHVSDSADRERVERERRTRGVSFREVAHDYLRWLEEVAGAKPSTLRDHRYLLGEPGTLHKRGGGIAPGHVMAALGDWPAAKITTKEINDLLSRVGATGISPRTVNKYRSVIAAAFSHACKPATFNLTFNPAQAADRRRQPAPAALAFYSPEEIEAVARALEGGHHSDRSRPAVSEDERRARQDEDRQDAEMVRVAAYAGLRIGVLLALRWGDVDFAGSALTVSRAISAGVLSSTKSGKVRRVPLADQAAAALERTSRREHFTSAADLVFCNALGRSLDDSALRRRYRRVQRAIGARALRFHDLRHTFGSLLASRGVDVVSIQAAMGHSAITTTSRYLHARPASEQVQAFTRAFEPMMPAVGTRASAQ